MTQPVDIEALRALLERATAGPWAYRPQEHDDWGFIRTMIATEDGWHPVVARANDVSVHEDHDAHRAAKTDPAEGNARLIVAAVNALPSLLTELEALRAERGRMKLDLEARDCLQDSAYKAGVKHGWNLCVSDDEDGYQRITNNTAHIAELKRIRADRASLKEPSQ